MASQIEIINKALILIGANPIANLSEGSAEATIANVIWDTSRTAALRDHPWNFAIKEEVLASLVASLSPNFRHTYLIPSDSLRILTVSSDYDYKIQGRYLHTDRDTCTVKYVYDNQDPTTWDALFVDALSFRLASEFAYPLTKSTSLMDAMAQHYMAKLQKARFVDATEDIQDPYADADHPLLSIRR